jgi:hypothetical protein
MTTGCCPKQPFIDCHIIRIILGFDSRRGLGIFPFTNTPRMALGPTQPPIQWVRGALSLGVKQPGREADHLPPSSAEVKEWVELHLHSPSTTSWRGAQLKHRDNVTLYLHGVIIKHREKFTSILGKNLPLLDVLFVAQLFMGSWTGTLVFLWHRIHPPFACLPLLNFRFDGADTRDSGRF